jgi:hypothetical protein
MSEVDARDIIARYFGRVQERVKSAWDDSRSRFPGAALICCVAVQREDSGDEKSLVTCLPLDSFMRDVVPNMAASVQTSDAIEQLQEKLPEHQCWVALTVPNGGTYTFRMRRSEGKRTVGIAGLMRAIDDRELMAMALFAWRVMRGERSDDLAKERDRIMQEFEDEAAEPLAFGQMWADGAYPKLVTSHKYAAALMCTTTRKEDVEDVPVPWKAFLVVVPDGLLGDFDRLRVWFKDATAVITVCSASRNIVPLHLSLPVADIFAADGDDHDDRVAEIDARIACAARRLVAGLLLAMQHTNNFRNTLHPAKERGTGRTGEPTHRVVFVGRPITVDCRRGLASYIHGGRHAPPSVQVLVRGHYKRQVIGVARTGRKVIWIEPYWRGPEEAPILTHPYQVGPVE